MDVKHLASSDYLKGDDLQGRQETVTVTGAVINKYDDGSKKVVLSFAESEKKLTLNKTRLKAMILLYGPDTDNWLGKRINLIAQQLPSGRFAGQWTIVILQAQQDNGSQTLDQDAQLPVTDEQSQQEIDF